MLEDEGKIVRVIAGSMRKVLARQDLKPKFSMQTLALALAHRCRSILITMSEPSTPWLATLRLRLMCLAPRNCWSFGPATASPYGQNSRPLHGAWRGANGWTPTHLVEFRLFEKRSHLGTRRVRVHPTSRA